MPWYGTENMETDALVMTHCGKTVDPVPLQLPELFARELEQAICNQRMRRRELQEMKRKQLAAYEKYFGKGVASADQEAKGTMKSNYTHIAMVLDRSGSMQSIASDTIGGVNQFWNSQKAVPGDCTATLVQFDDVIETVFDAQKIADVKPLDSKTYVPRNSTALYDAVGQTIARTGDWLMKMPEAERPEKVIVAIVTDGMENASDSYSCARVFDMIKHQREVYKWEFVFIGANQDAFAAGAAIGIPSTHSINYASNTVGTQKIYGALGKNVTAMRCSAASTVEWEKQDRDEQNEAGANNTPTV